jgi:glycosyltransferase involved in cell wall biosynthesis
VKITIVSPPFNMAGGQRVKAIYAQRLEQRGHEVIVVAPPPEIHRRPMDILKSILREGRLPRGPKPWPSHFDGTGIRTHILDRYRPVDAGDLPDADIVIATWWETAEWVAPLPPSKGAKVYLIQHHEVFPYLPIDRVEATWRLPLHKIVVSEWLVGIARDLYGDEDALLVPNAVDHDQFHAPERTKNTIPTFGLMYSSVPFKRCDLSLKGFALACERMPGLKLVAFGAERVSQALPLPANAEYFFSPPQTQIRDIYARCDAWLFSSESEGFGLPVLEALACRTPVIGTPAGAASQLLAEGGGILVRHDDPEDIAQAICRVASMTPKVWKEMSDAATRTALKYDWEASTELLEAALHRYAHQEKCSTRQRLEVKQAAAVEIFSAANRS